MTTNKEWFNSLDSDELKAWLNADHDTPTIVSGDDSRAQLEDDIAGWLGSWTAFSVPINTVKQAVFGWLDRQAAITERKLCNSCEWPSLAAMPDVETQARVDKLTIDLQVSHSEREHWRNVCVRLIDKTHEMQSIYDEGLA